MKNCLRRARRAVVRDCDTDLYAASAKEKAIACLSTVARCRCNSKLRSDGNARARRKTLGIPVECRAALPPASRRPGPVTAGRAYKWSTNENLSASLRINICCQCIALFRLCADGAASATCCHAVLVTVTAKWMRMGGAALQQWSPTLYGAKTGHEV
jgi:hypothetical protein